MVLPPLPVRAPLDRYFLPPVLYNRCYRDRIIAKGKAVPLVIGLERENGLLSRFETIVDPSGDPETLRYVERIIKFLLWSRGGWKLHFGGPKVIADHLRKIYSLRGIRKFDCQMMTTAYGRKFEIFHCTANEVPQAKESHLEAGGNLKGCRIGFDLGAVSYTHLTLPTIYSV